MPLFDEEPPKKKKPHELGEDLSRLSVDELAERIALLKAEIARLEEAMAAKRADYFEAGTAVVWDVDTIREVVRKYRADAPDRPILFVRGQEADAEPAVPGWRMAVDRLFA